MILFVYGRKCWSTGRRDRNESLAVCLKLRLLDSNWSFKQHGDTPNTQTDKEIHMPIDIDAFESSSEDRLQHSGETNAARVIHFLAANPDQAFTQSEIREETDVKAGSISVVLSRLEDRGLVRHKGTYWALGEADEIAAYTNIIESTQTANDRFGEEDIEEWLEYAVDS